MRHRVVLSFACAAMACTTASAETLLFDFGRTDRQSDPNQFNNFIPAVASIPNTINDAGNPSGISAEIVDAFFNTGEPSQLGTESPTGVAAQFGADATDDYFFGHTTAFAGADPNPLAIIEFGNFAPTDLVTFTIFSSRANVTDNRETQFDVIGGNGASGALNPSNNDSAVLVIPGITPDGAGNISLNVSPGLNNDNTNGFYYLNAIRIDIVPAPGTLGIAGLGALVLLRRRR